MVGLGVVGSKDEGEGFAVKLRLSARGSVALYIDVPGLFVAMIQNIRVCVSLLGGSVYVNDSFNPTKTTASGTNQRVRSFRLDCPINLLIVQPCARLAW